MSLFDWLRQPPAPDPGLAIERYRRHAPGYDASAERTMPLRRRTVGLLGLQPGQTVLDVACGTGLSFGLLQGGVGPQGRIVGVELSADMLDVARRRVSGEGWSNVTLVQAAMEGALIPGPVDAVLFNFTHDVLRSAPALANVFAAVRPGARVAVAGMKLAPWWLAPLNLLALAKARPYMTTFEGLDRPWSRLENYLERFDWEPVMAGIGYIGHGTARPDLR
jgi:demethylmenaquinone methyltransferase/2-methoxy-6-polyprenyl-1,4-benzoquinol methylase